MKSNLSTYPRSSVPTLINAQGLHKSFGENHAVRDVSLQVKAGEIYGLVGPDGAGKTTTIRMLVGALRVDAGEIDVCGYDVTRQVEKARSQFGYLSQRFSLYEDLTVLENIRFFAEVRGLSAKEWLPRSMEILEFVGLADFTDRRAGQLSGGMKQKLGLASALVTRPRVLLLDEPTTGVDPVTRQDFWQLVIHLVSPSPTGKGARDEGGVSVLLTTPYMDEAARCHRIGFMREGKIIAEGTPAELRSTLEGRILELRGQPISLLRKIAHQDEDVEDVQAFGDRLHVRVGVDKAKVVLGRLKSTIRSGGGDVTDLRPVPPVLEDVFIALSESESKASGLREPSTSAHPGSRAGGDVGLQEQPHD
ncbi:MAG: ATP-binding cassette domain-containing protein [Anaerolineales bacterium]|jgi:ABC-2 type transport system ATP-binding protein